MKAGSDEQVRCVEISDCDALGHASNEGKVQLETFFQIGIWPQLHELIPLSS